MNHSSVKRLANTVGVIVLLTATWLILRRYSELPPAEPYGGTTPDPTAVEEPLQARPGVIRHSGQLRRSSAARQSVTDLPVPSSPDVELPGAERDRIPGEYVLGFYSWQESDAFVRAAREAGIEIIDRMALGNAVRIRTADESLLQRLMARVARPSRFGANYYVRLPPPPAMEDKRAPESGYLGFGPASPLWLGAAGDNAAWGSGVKIAILDTAVARHPAIPEDRVTRYEIDGGLTASDGPAGLHGAAVASIIVGEAEGLRGMAPAAEILSIPVVSSDGQGDAFTLARGIVEAVTLGASVINLSLGSYGDSVILEDAVDYALDNGVAVVASTGNDAVRGVMYPAGYDGVIAVGAVDADYRHLYFSNRGDEVDITAPGIAVSAAGPNGQVGLFSGTSAAAPFVSGALAAVLSENPGMSASEAGDLLMLYADDKGTPGRDEEYGNGVLNMARVMERDDDE